MEKGPEQHNGYGWDPSPPVNAPPGNEWGPNHDNNDPPPNMGLAAAI